MSLIFVDVEADFNSPCPGIGPGMTEFGAIEYESEETFYGLQANPETERATWGPTFVAFKKWLQQFKGRPVFVSDNPAFDWQWINYWFHHTIGKNPFGHSARRISDFYAGLVEDFYKTQDWKKFRITKHDHNPVNDARGNLEAFKRLLDGERP